MTDFEAKGDVQGFDSIVKCITGRSGIEAMHRRVFGRDAEEARQGSEPPSKAGHGIGGDTGDVREVVVNTD